MKTTQIQKVFHPSDFTQGDEPAFEHALKIAQNTGAELDVLHVEESTDKIHWSDFPSVRSVLLKWGLLPPNASENDVAQSGLRVRKVQRISANPAKAISHFIQDHQPDLVVLATHQRKGLARLVHPALAEAVARQTHTMTLFVPRRSPGFVSPGDGSIRLRNILIPIDHDPRPQRAVDAAVDLAELLGATPVHFTFFHAGDPENAPQVNLPLPPNWTSETDAWEGNVVDHILNVANDRSADLIVMATAGHHGFLDALRGSTTERVLHGSPCPLLAVPGR